MRWSGQQVLDDGVGAETALPGLRGLLRSVRTPEFAGTVFHEVEAKSVLNRVPGSSPVPFRWTVNPYRGCSHACVYCLAGPTRVLLADGRTRPIAELRVGDAVLGTERVDGRRRYVRTTVLAHWSTTRPAHVVRLAGGTEIVSSGEHRFLTERGWRHVAGGWCRFGRRPRLKPGAVLLGPGRTAGVGPGAAGGRRVHTAAYRQGYLCGLVRGDGSRFGRPGTAGLGRGYDDAGLGVNGTALHGAGDAPAGGPDGWNFPSAELDLEALGRAHHFLAEAAHRVAVPVAVGGGEPGRIARTAGAGGIASVGDAVRWPADAGADWCAGFLAGMVDAAGSTVRGELRIGPVGGGDRAGADHVAGEEVIGRVQGALHRLGFRFAVDIAAPGIDPDGIDPDGIDPDGGPGVSGRGGIGPGGAGPRGTDPAGTDPAGVGAVRGARSVRLLGGPEAFLRLLQVIDPAVTRLRDLGGAPVTGSPALEVVSVRPLGVEKAMYDITTGTGDFVAEGLISHNCFARNTHTYLDLDAGADFDSQIVVKVNVARVLERELRAARWAREAVAMGTNTDPYQRAEGRYRLMPDVIGALARSGTPFSILTKGTVLARDLPEITAASADVPVGLGVSIALTDRSLQARLEPGTPSPAARLDLVRRITDAGLSCGVMVAPVLPLLTDSADALDELLGRIAAAGATGASVLALHLRPGTREWFLAWLAREHPRLVEPYGRLYRRGAYVDPEYRRALGERVAPLLRRHGLTGAVTTLRGQVAPGEAGSRSAPSRGQPAGRAGPSRAVAGDAGGLPPPGAQLSLM